MKTASRLLVAAELAIAAFGACVGDEFVFSYMAAMSIYSAVSFRRYFKKEAFREECRAALEKYRDTLEARE